MIDKNQLRPGNWVRTDEGQYGTVIKLDRYIMVAAFSCTRGFSSEQLDPIIVTSDILSLAEFELYDSVYIHKRTGLQLRYHGEGDVKLMHDNHVIEEFAYVHQMQNIYSDATGQLLEPNLMGI
jgi:hypothetical protein